MNVPFITYTNSKCSDAWPVYFNLLYNYYGPSEHCIINDKDSPAFPSGSQKLFYKNEDPFYDAWTKLLPSIPSDFFIYMQEDFFLYKPVDKLLLGYYYLIMLENPEISFVRLLKSGIQSNLPVENVSTLFNVDYSTDYAFSMQPTLWRKSAFLKIQETKIQKIPWDEPKIDGQVLNSLGIRGFYHYDKEPKRGMNHYDSTVFPYIATALVKGKWNTYEYKELKPILDEHKIDIKIRGEYNGT